MAERLEASPMDKHKAKFGELNQANYLLLAKENSAASKQLFDDKNLEIKEENREKVITSPFKHK